MYHRADNEDDRVLQACLRVRSTATTGATGAAAAACADVDDEAFWEGLLNAPGAGGVI